MGDFSMDHQAVVFNPKAMPFRRLGSSGLRVPLFSLGGWLTMGLTVKGDPVKEIVKTAYEHGINMFDTAENYAHGQSEVEMGRVIRELGLRRTNIIVSTKLFFGEQTDGPNDMGLSRKHIISGTQASLQRLGLDYVDVIFAHRSDMTVSIEEVVRAFNYVIDKGWAFYWATSEWSAFEIEEAHHVAEKLGLQGPIVEQCQHNMFCRERPEKEYSPLYKKYGIGKTVFSALASGLLTGKYNNGIPEGSRFADPACGSRFKGTVESFSRGDGQAKLDKVQKLSDLAKNELDCTVGQLALAWVARDPNTSSVILGASKHEQVLDNLKALDVIPKLTPEVLDKIDAILENKPARPSTFGRPPLDELVSSV